MQNTYIIQGGFNHLLCILYIISIKKVVVLDNYFLNSNNIIGVPEGIRTPDPLVRSQILYPAELQAQLMLIYHIINSTACQHSFQKNILL